MARSSTPDDGMVTVVLSHPLPSHGVDALGLQDHPDVTEKGTLPLETELRVYPDIARTLMEAGYTTLDPENPADRAKVDSPAPAAPVPGQAKASAGS